MATKIKSSALTTELRDYMTAAKKKKTAESTQNTQQNALSDELKDFLNKRKESGTLLSGTLSDEERQAYADKTSAIKTQKFKSSERQEADKRAAQQAKRADTIANGTAISEVEPKKSTLGDDARYVQERGRNAFAIFNENLNTLGEGLYQGGKAFFDEFTKPDNGSSLDNAIAAFRAGYLAAGDKAAEENYAEKLEAETSEKYKESASKPVVKAIADTVSSANTMLPAAAVSAATGGVGGAAVMGLQSMPDAYINARNSGATQDQALGYSALEALNNSVGEMLIGGFLGKGAGLLGKGLNTVTKGASGRFISSAMNSIAKSPLGKTALSTVSKAAGEGAEEVAQGLISTINERLTYNPDAKVDVGDLAYEGLIGSLMGGAFQIAGVPAQYQAYRSDYDTVNGFSLASEAVRSENDVQMLRQIGNSIIKQADELISDKKSDTDTVQRTAYIKNGIQTSLNLLEKNSESIISGNANKAAALETAISSTPESAKENIVSLVRAVSADGKSANRINKTIDFVRGEIQNAKNEAATAVDENTRRQANENLVNYQEIDRALRSYRKEIGAELDSSAASEVDVGTNTAENAQQSSPTSAEDTQAANLRETVSSPSVESNADTGAEEAVAVDSGAAETSAVNTEADAEGAVAEAENASQFDPAETASFERSNISDSLDIDLTGNAEQDAEALLDARRGVRGAVDQLTKTANEIRSSGSESAESDIAYIRELDRAVREKNRAYTQKKANAYAAVLKQWGIKNVVVDDNLAYNYSGDDVRANGYYDRSSGEIHLSPYLSEDAAVGSIVVHEFTHRGAAADSSLVDSLLEAKNKMEAAGVYKGPDRSAYLNAYGDLLNGMSESDSEAYINEEIAAHFMQDIMENENVLEALAREDRTMLQRILDFIADFFDKSGRENRAAERAADKIRAVLKKSETAKSAGVEVAQRVKGTDAKSAEAQKNSNGIRYSMAGVRADSADNSSLSRAVEMSENGADSESIRKETGWFKSYDGKWRFEVDDSGMQINLTDDTPNYLTLGELIDHPKLFEAYPELKNVDVVFQNLNGAFGSYQRQFDTINLDRGLRNNPKQLKSTLLHEIQHAIQYTERFANGASPNYWDRQIASGFDSRTQSVKEEAARLWGEYNRIKEESPEFFDDMTELKTLEPNVPRGAIDWDTLEQIEEDPPEWKKYDAEQEKLVQKYGEAKVFDFINLSHNILQVELNSGRDASELYYNTAGEIEARDTAERADMDAEQRKNTRPDIDRKDVVFAEGSMAANDIVVLENGNTYVKASRNVITGKTLSEQRKQITEFFNTLLKKNKSLDIQTIQGDVLTITQSDTANKARDNFRNESGKRIRMSDDEFRVKLNAEAHIDELAEVSVPYVSDDDNKNHAFAKDGFTYRSAYFEDFDGQLYKLDISVGQNGTVATIYNIGKIKESKPSSAKIIAAVGSTALDSMLSDNSIAKNNSDVNSETEDVTQSQQFNPDIRYSRSMDGTSSSKITDGMSESERFDILKERTIQLKAKTDYSKMLDAADEIEDIETLPLKEKKKLLQRLGEQFGVFKGYQNADIELEFEYSRGGLKESVQKQNKKYNNFAKMLSCFDDVIDSAVGIEAHNRNGVYKTDSSLNNVYVLVSAFEDGENIIPVKLEVKEFNDPNIGNTLYVSIALEEIKKDEIVTTPSPDSDQNYVAPSSAISIADLFAHVNTSDGSFLKYIPDGFLDESQRKAKTDYIEHEKAVNEKNDIRYSRVMETEEQRELRRKQERIEYLEKQFRSHTALGWAKTVSPASRRTFASEIAAKIPGVTVEEVSASLKKVYDILEAPKRGSKDTAEVRWNEAREAASEAARQLVESASANEINPLYEQYNDLRNRLRTVPVKMTISRGEFGGDEDYREWRRGNVGLLRISDSADALPVDTFYQGLSAQYPEFFPPEVENEADQLKRLGDAAVELRRIAGSQTEKVNPLEDIAESFAADLTNQILFGFDRLAKTTEGARREYGGMMNENDVRQAYAEGASEAAYREQTAYETGVKEGRTYNEKEVQAAAEREEIQRQIFERDFRAAQRNFSDEIKRQNDRIASLESRISRKSESDRLTMDRKSTLATLNRLNTMLTKPNRSKHIPQNLRAPVARLLETLGTTRLPNGKTVNAETMRDIQEAEYARFEAECARAVDDMRTSINSNRVSENNSLSDQFIEKLTDNIERLKEIYAEINPASPDDAVLPPDLMTSRRTDYVRQVGRILGMVEHYVKDANVVFLNDKAVSAREFSEKMISELRQKKGRVQETGKASQLRERMSGMGYEFVSADLFFEMMGDSGVELMHEYRRGQTLQAQHEDEFTQYMLKATGGKYSTHNAGFSGDLISLSIDGKGLKVTKGQLMQLYLTWKRPAGRRHLMTGGAVFTNEIGQESEANTVRITQDIYDDLVAHLSKEDIAVCDAIGKFLSKRCAEWGNEASMKMYGYRMFEDPNYFPLDVSKHALSQNWDSIDEFYRLENAGMTKSLKSDASAPLRMTDVFDVADFHVRTMAAYGAFAPISNDVQRIMNMPGVTEAVDYGMGRKGTAYLNKLVKTIASNKVRTGDISDAAAPLSFFMNAYKRQAVSFNISTALKQPLSIVRALNEIEGKYIRKAPLVMSNTEYKRIYDTMVENSGVAKMKVLGYSDTGFGKSMRQIYDTDYVNESGIIRGTLGKSKGGRTAVKAYDKITDAGMWMAGKADEMTWVRIWKACELEVTDKYKGLNAEEKTRRAAERFNDIIGRTQVVDTVLDTSPLMRSNAAAIFTPFMNEPTKALATMITAADAARDGKPYGKKKLAKAVGLVALNNLVLEPIISTLMTMWRDEEDDTENIADFTKKFLKVYAGVNIDDGFSFAEFAASNVVGGIFSFPIIQIFYDTVVDSTQNYSNEKIDTAAVSNLVKNTIRLVTGLQKPKEDRAKSNYKLFSDFLGSAAAAIGIPLPTLRRQTAALYRGVLNATDSYELQWEYNKVLYNLENSSARSQKGFYDIMAAAYKAGDVEAYRKMRTELSEIVSDTPSVISPKSITKAIKDRGGEVVVGSDLWYVDLQARFCLEKFVPKMQAETLITNVYRDAESKGIDASSLLLSMPSAYEYESEDGESQKMTSVEYEDYIRDVGLLSYQVLVEMNSTSRKSSWNSLTTEQQIYAIEKAYAYAKAKCKKDFDSNYNIRSQGVWMDELYSQSAGQSKIASTILAEAKEK